ncbi:hypothetical protein [Halorubellus sp. PRR65]|uniref:hypothetical protein n=1 Tax=Halorubellus sp. PRR65 TaxID=3098148 RepID=UPI002B25F3AF|nr:hypothetical protein [Halorubellus sp. PRR65]
MARKPKHGRKRVDNAVDRVRDVNPRSLAAKLEYLSLYLLGTAAFIAIAVVLAYVATTGAPLLAATAGIILFVWAAATIRPHLNSVENFAAWLWSADSADWLYDTWCRIIPWRDGRGSATVKQAVALAMAVLLMGSALGAVAPAGATTSSTSSTAACSEKVVHDWPLTNATAQTFNNSSSVDRVVANTKVSIEHTDSFYRVRAENPNAYCVHVTVRIHEDIIPPTELGSIASVNGTTTAEWHDITEFESQETYTEIKFTLSGGESAMFAPSEPAVLIPAWRDQQKREAEGFLAQVTSTFDFESPFDDDTEQLKSKTYEFSKPNGSDYLTVRLDNRTTNQTIDEWYALSRPAGSKAPWDPITQESDAGVFYRIVDGGSKLQFVFNNPNATVRFVANPEAGDKLDYDVESLHRSLYELKESLSLPFTIVFSPRTPQDLLSVTGLGVAAATRKYHP